MAYKDKATATKKQNEWISKAYDRINLTVPKGNKAVIQAHVDAHGHNSVNSFINEAIVEKMARENEKED